ncbi:MAG: peroxiredoxin-like family protein [Thermomicrobiales bacterium]
MPAPTFQTNDLFGNPVDLASYRGRPLLLSFFRNAACALCNLRVHMLIERHAEFERAGLAVVAIFESAGAAMREHVGKQDAPFPLIPDPEARLYDLYGVENSAEKVEATMALPGTHAQVAAAAERGFPLTKEEGSNFLRMPADFLVGPDGSVLEAHYADYVWDHLPFERIDAFLGVAVTGR